MAPHLHLIQQPLFEGIDFQTHWEGERGGGGVAPWGRGGFSSKKKNCSNASLVLRINVLLCAICPTPPTHPTCRYINTPKRRPEDLLLDAIVSPLCVVQLPPKLSSRICQHLGSNGGPPQ